MDRINHDDSYYGGFVISKNVNLGRPIRYSYREQSMISQLNGWTLYSCDDNNEYVSDTNNFIVVGATTIRKLAPVMLELFDAPYGTDLCWLYEKDVLVGFYDLKANRNTTIEEILNQSNQIEGGAPCNKY